MSNRILFQIVFVLVLRHGQGTTNFALHKPALQSSTLNWIFYWTADKAVDGNTDGSDPDRSGTCSATQLSDKAVNNTWEVNIGFPIIMKTIAVYGRTDRGIGALDGIQLYFRNASGSSMIYNQRSDIDSSNTRYVYKPIDVIASIVSLMMNAKIMVLCEVTVDGECPDGNYYEFCNATCGKCIYDEPCNKTDGRCPRGCDKGWKGDFCKEECETGNYGYNCKETCRNCLYGNNSCSKLDGNCDGGCIAGWHGFTCSRECETGNYGYNCKETCGNCLNGNSSCSKIDGNCDGGCIAGWHGFTCSRGTTNFALHKPAVQSSTLYWFFPWTADKAVDGNTDGSDPERSWTCSATQFSTNLVNNTWEVNIGFPIIMKTITVFGRTDGGNGALDGIQLYFRNASGSSMIYNQRSDIDSSNTRYVYKPIDVIASIISLMMNAKIMVLCEVTVDGECLDGNYSEFCNATCGKCIYDEPCNKTDGKCPRGCDKGWKGVFCKEECEIGNYGYNCKEICGNCLNGNNSCSKLDGKCTDGCIAGWQGFQCSRDTEEMSRPGDVPNVGVIVGSVAAAVGVSVFAIAIIVFTVKKRKKTSNERRAEALTTVPQYANLVVGNPDSVLKVTDRCIPKTNSAYSGKEEKKVIENIPISMTNSPTGVKEANIYAHSDYEQLQDATRSAESAYSTINHNHTDSDPTL